MPINLSTDMALLTLGSEAFASVSTSNLWLQPGFTPSTPTPRRSNQRRIVGNVRVVFFDFDGTLTATPGDRAERRNKIAELKERAPLLEPWLRKLREAQIILGIVSKSSGETIATALRGAALDELFDGPIIGKAITLEGKAGVIVDACTNGALSHLGPDGMRHVLLVDDDVLELVHAHERSIQTYPAPQNGGLLDEDFYDIFHCLDMTPPQCTGESREAKEVHRMWTHGLTGQSMGVSTASAQLDYTPGNAPLFNEYYDVMESRRLGSGSFGTCKAAVHIASGLPCAVKFIRKDIVGDRYLENFVDQDMHTFLLKMAHHDPHPNVVRQLDYLMGPKVIYNTMDLLEGPDLYTYLEDNAPITRGFARYTMQHIFAALRHIHHVSGTGLIHRDVKLENLKFRTCEPDSDLVLLDFGLSCPARPDQKRAVVGTLPYMAPEIFSGHYDSQVDLWSAGVLFYVVLTGMLPLARDRSVGLCTSREARRLCSSEAEKGAALASALEANEIRECPALAVELLRGLLAAEPSARLTAAAALDHAWLSERATNGEAGEELDWQTGRSFSVESSTYASTPQSTGSRKSKCWQVGSQTPTDLDPSQDAVDPRLAEVKPDRTRDVMQQTCCTPWFAWLLSSATRATTAGLPPVGHRCCRPRALDLLCTFKGLLGLASSGIKDVMVGAWAPFPGKCATAFALPRGSTYSFGDWSL